MPLKTLLDNIFEFMHQKLAPPSEVLGWPYWYFEEMIKRLNKRNEEEAKKQKSHQEEAGANMPQAPNMSSFNNTLNSMRSKIGR